MNEKKFKLDLLIRDWINSLAIHVFCHSQSFHFLGKHNFNECDFIENESKRNETLFEQIQMQ